MKNLITRLDKLENLPKKTGINKDMHNHLYDDYGFHHSGDGLWQYTRRFLKKHIGQSFNEVFHKYLIHVKHKYMKGLPYMNPQYVFKYNFNNRNEFYVDSNGLIQYTKNYREKHDIKSPIIEYRYYPNNIYPYTTHILIKYLGLNFYNKIKEDGVIWEDYLRIVDLCNLKWDIPFTCLPIMFSNWEELSKSKRKQLKKELDKTRRKQERDYKKAKNKEVENLLHTIEKERIKPLPVKGT